MLILGIDPGTATTGFGLVRLNGEGNEVVTWGLIETSKTLLKERRLDFIFEETVALIKKHKEKCCDKKKKPNTDKQKFTEDRDKYSLE